MNDTIVALVVVLVLNWLTLANSTIRWQYIIGNLGIIMLGMGFSTIGTTAPYYIAMLFCILIGGIRILETVWEIFE